jgi:very-short-patch-repair endonuclease
MKVLYNPYLKGLARNLRNDSTKSEIRLWQYLKGKQMHGYDFHRQKPIGKYITDFFCNKLKLVIELDGYSHQLDEVIKRDVKKESDLKVMGIFVLRFQDEEVFKDIENVIRTIENYILDFETGNLKDEY